MKDIKTLFRMMRQLCFILNRKQKLQMVGVFFVILIGSLFELLGVMAIMPFVQAILTPDDLRAKPYIGFFCDLFRIKDNSTLIIMVGLAIVAVYLVKNAYLLFSSYTQAAYGTGIQKALELLMLRSYIRRPYSFFVNHGTDTILQGVGTDTNGVYNVLTNVFKLLSELLVILSISIFLVNEEWMLALGVLGVGVICLLVIVLGLKRKISKLSALSRSSSAQKYKWLYQITGGIKDILVYSRQNHFLVKFEIAQTNYRRAMTYYNFSGSIPERIIEAFCISGIIIMVLIRMGLGIDVDLFIPKLSVFAAGAFRMLPSVSRTAGYINNLVFYRQYVDYTYDNIKSAQLYTAQLAEQEQALRKSKDIRKNEFCKDIEIKDIDWTYDEGTNKVLNHLSLSIKKGEAVGIIGGSGSGKSTLADIVLRLYHPQNGEILMDGINIDAIPRIWSKMIGYVPQSVFLVDDTVRENVIFGADDPNDERVWEALRKASLDEFVKQLPNGLETIVGERGVKFSGGQRQRIAIARALYADPQILILDEATSALDNDTEEVVMEAIDSLAGSITLIIIAHRVSTLKNCNRIYEIVNGMAQERNKNEVLGNLVIKEKDYE